jgi:hypothetical protein
MSGRAPLTHAMPLSQNEDSIIFAERRIVFLKKVYLSFFGIHTFLGVRPLYKS